ncbi:hypothetical protein J1N35_000956 [Gossypium stocksii]|uniref:Uncharacterized protein n=1 Tax=Gossypium stocksii TaxID=47602 RepID=A0A9D3WJC2_9ROSI|nr:hypothetical protein J1N35_000956 [Gossypium stocksii]
MEPLPLKPILGKSSSRVADTFNLHSYLKVSTIVDARGLSCGERLFRWSKCDAHFELTMVTVSK